MARIYIKTYGCQMNERDSEQVAQMLMERGHTITVKEEEADVVLLNTCSVRDLAEQKALGKMGMLRAPSSRSPGRIRISGMHGPKPRIGASG